MLAIATFEGEEPAVVKRGRGDVMDMKPGLKNERDDIKSTSNRKTLSQLLSIIFFLTYFFNPNQTGLSESIIRPGGREGAKWLTG